MTERFFIHPDSRLPYDFPMAKLSNVLALLGYRPASIEAICEHVSSYGTAEGCLNFRNDAERSLIENLLPSAPDEAWEHAEGVAF